MRLAFGKKHQLETRAQSCGIATFSDEPTFLQFVVRKRLVYRPPSKCFDEKFTISTITHAPKQMFWGEISENDVAVLYFYLVSQQ